MSQYDATLLVVILFLAISLMSITDPIMKARNCDNLIPEFNPEYCYIPHNYANDGLFLLFGGGFCVLSYCFETLLKIEKATP